MCMSRGLLELLNGQGGSRGDGTARAAWTISSIATGSRLCWPSTPALLGDGRVVRSDNPVCCRVHRRVGAPALSLAAFRAIFRSSYSQTVIMRILSRYQICDHARRVPEILADQLPKSFQVPRGEGLPQIRV